MQHEWSIHEVARLAGTTPRTLRHYGDIGLLPPSRTGANGYRYYDGAALTRLQRILLLRELGLSLSTIDEVLHGATDDAAALSEHLRWLREEHTRIDRQIAAIEATVQKLEQGEELMAEEMFDGFDHTQHKDEIEERWGSDAYATSDAWWRSKTEAEKSSWMSRQKQLADDWSAAAASGSAPDAPEAQALAQRHYEWLAGIPATPRATSASSNAPGPSKEYLLGLGDMYVADERFAANYGGVTGAEFVRDALRVFVERNEPDEPDL